MNRAFLPKLILSCLFVYFFARGDAQSFGGTPSYQKWKKIELSGGTLLFPMGIDSISQRVASIIQRLDHRPGEPVSTHPRKFNTVLRVNGLQSNGYVQLAPFRSEFFITPPQNAFQLGAQEWIGTLSLHEFRHIEQYNAFNIGLSHAGAVLFGQGGQALLNAASVPDWFFEGDAVFHETLLSNQGRGRLPAFFNGYRSLFFENKKYDYQQLRNGSYKHYIPDHYQLGYLLIAYGTEKYGTDFWNNITVDAASFKNPVYPLQSAIKRKTGLPYKQFVNDAFEYYHRQWNQEREQNPLNWITKPIEKDVVNYQYPYATGSGFIVLKSSKKEVPAFYAIDSNGKEEKIRTKNISIDSYFSYNNGKIVYASYKPNARWDLDFNRLTVIDVASKSERTIEEKTKFVSPDISHDGTKIVSVSNVHGKPFELVIYDLTNGSKMVIQSKTDGIFYYPKFSSGDSSIYFFESNKEGKMQMAEIELSSGKQTVLLPYQNRILGFPVVNNDTITYSCTNNGRDEVWAYVKNQSKHFRLYSYSTGLYQGTFEPTGNLLVSVFTADGYQIANVQPLWQATSFTELYPLYVQTAYEKSDSGFLFTNEKSSFSVEKYRKSNHPFNFHSWYPTADDPDYTYTVYGNNVLNNIQSELYYNFNKNENSHRIGFSGVFGGSYVMPFLGISRTWHRTAQSEDNIYHFNEWNGTAGISLPLNLSGGKFFRSLNLTTSYNVLSRDWTGIGKQKFNDGFNSYVDSRVSFTLQQQMAEQHIFPQWGQSIQIRMRKLLEDAKTYQLTTKASMFFPGIGKTHSTVVSAAFQLRDTFNVYAFSNDFPFSRGYTALNFPIMWKASFNYHFPLAYPDFGFANIVYLKRLRANFFYDFTRVESKRTGLTSDFASAGAEMYVDTRWWNQHPLTFGLRYSRLLHRDVANLSANQWELILPVLLLQ